MMIMKGGRMIYQEIKEKLENRKYADITELDYQDFIDQVFIDYIAYQLNGETLSEEYKELKDWVYNRVNKNIQYQITGYLNDHFCIGAVFGILMTFDRLANIDSK